MSILVVGSVAIDSIKTPFGKRDNILGGSATFFSMSASYFNHVDIIAIVGEDFPDSYRSLFAKKGIGTSGLVTMPGKTFRWVGSYDYDLNKAHTICTKLNVFSEFNPVVPKNLRRPKTLFLANIDPDIQRSILKQVNRPPLVACDTMNFWIENKIKSLKSLLPKIDIFLLNESEARQFTGEYNLIKAARSLISAGPKTIVIKKGEHGVMCFTKDSHFIAPAYALETAYDPTGAGDTFAGGMIGYLSRYRKINDQVMRRSVIYGNIMASFAVEDFSVNRLLRLSTKEIEERVSHFKQLTKF